MELKIIKLTFLFTRPLTVHMGRKEIKPTKIEVLGYFDIGNWAEVQSYSPF